MKWSTTALNHIFVRIGTTYRTFLHYWFTIGVVFGGFVMILSIVILLLNLFWTLRTPSAHDQILTPIVRHYNLHNIHNNKKLHSQSKRLSRFKYSSLLISSSWGDEFLNLYCFVCMGDVTFRFRELMCPLHN